MNLTKAAAVPVGRSTAAQVVPRALPDGQEFRAALAAQDVELPLRLSKEDIGVIVDTKGRGIITIDVNNERDDIQVVLIAQQLALAVNAVGGFTAPEDLSSEADRREA